MLFADPAGTGKTMAIGVIAREVGLDLVKVDLPGLLSKYIGETEKNFDRAFASARATRCSPSTKRTRSSASGPR